MPVVIVIALVVGAFVFTRVSGFVLRRLVRHMAERTPAELATRWWRVGSPRGDTDEAGDARRRQRVDSASRMLNHLLAIVVWIGVAIAVFHILDIDAEYFLSSAGFIGAGIAIGGQHKVNDYLTGLSVLFEDRYGAGDELIVEVGKLEPVHAVVDHVGLFTTRLRDATSTLHVPNGQLQTVRNLSQEARTEAFRLRVGANPEYDVPPARGDDGDLDVDTEPARPPERQAGAGLVERTERARRGK